MLLARLPITYSDLAAPSLTASGHIIANPTPTTTFGTDEGWKTRAWDAYDSVGELRYIATWTGNALSRVRLYAADVSAAGQPSSLATDTPDVAQIVASIAGGPTGQAEMLNRLGVHLTVVGESWLAMITREEPGGEIYEEWHVLSADEITNRAGTITFQLEDNTRYTYKPDTDLLIRVHRPHPRNSRLSDSPVRAALPSLEEINRASSTIDGAGRSRLAGNGILVLPNEISMPVSGAPTGDPDAPGLPASPGHPMDRGVSASDVMVQLQKVMTTAISDRSSAAALVPIVMKAPGDVIDKIRHIRFESDLTETALHTRDSAIRRLAMALETPAEVLTGVGETNHWNAWSIDEATIKTHIAPLMKIICHALTRCVLRPILKTQGLDPDAYAVWFDVSDLAKPPNRAEDAVAAFDRGAISPDTLRQSLGFSDDDAPATVLADGDQRQLALQLVKAAPSLLPYLSDILGITLTPGASPLASTPGASPAPAPVVPGTPTPGARAQ